MAAESVVTIAVARFLGKRDWRVVSMALPSGGSGKTFRPSFPELPVIVPDIIATNATAQKAIIVEAKPKYSKSDVAKLLSLRSGNYEDSIQRQLSLGSKNLILCIAFAQPLGIDFEKQDVDLVLTVDDAKQVKIEFDRDSIFS